VDKLGNKLAVAPLKPQFLQLFFYFSVDRTVRVQKLLQLSRLDSQQVSSLVFRQLLFFLTFGDPFGKLLLYFADD